MKNLNKNPKKTDPKQPEDTDFWQEVVKGVRKIPVSNIDLSKPHTELPEIRQNINIFEFYQGERLDYLRAGSFNNIDANTVKRFKRGEFRIEARLDLHGCLVDEAYQKVETFLQNAVRRGLRCVQIITGKGLHRENEDIFAARGVLKDLVPQWLNQDHIRPLLLAFDYSPVSEGGDGALMLLLRRKPNF
mgnify:FL=1